MQRNGVLLINLGTPDAPTPPALRRYLREFLTDPYVIDLPTIFRWFLVYGIILPTRPQQSAKSYQKIWQEEGSPLLVYSKQLKSKLQNQLGENWSVELAMRYGSPSIETALKSLLENEKLNQLYVFPLYPQYALSSFESSVQKFKQVYQKLSLTIPYQVGSPFYDENFFIHAVAEQAKPYLEAHDFDRFLFSFHGLPERHVQKTDPTGSTCLKKENCCSSPPQEVQASCYRFQCFETAHQIANQLDIPPKKYQVCFQSRLGRAPWLKPYTDFLLQELGESGVKRVAVFCPSFVADCLETLEEIGVRGKEIFYSAGGEKLVLIPSLNASHQWTQGLANKLNHLANEVQTHKDPSL